jgi:hypothetical protein
VEERMRLDNLSGLKYKTQQPPPCTEDSDLGGFSGRRRLPVWPSSISPLLGRSPSSIATNDDDIFLTELPPSPSVCSSLGVRRTVAPQKVVQFSVQDDGDLNRGDSRFTASVKLRPWTRLRTDRSPSTLAASRLGNILTHQSERAKNDETAELLGLSKRWKTGKQVEQADVMWKETEKELDMEILCKEEEEETRGATPGKEKILVESSGQDKQVS